MAKPPFHSLSSSHNHYNPLNKSKTQMTIPRLTLLIFLLLNSFFALSTFAFGSEEEEFSEELLLKPLSDRKLLAHFHFQTQSPPTSSYGSHHRLFPKAIYQLVQKFQIREMELSFTQGRWNYERWGGYDPISSNNAKPPGVELWAVFDVPADQVDATWKNLTHTLSGLFCASINFLESSTSYSSPLWSFRRLSGSLRYGSLPREAVCTENLTPWLKLLPCRDKDGLSTLLDRPSIYKGFYHSQRLHLTSAEFGFPGPESGTVLEQTLTVVLQPNILRTSIVDAKERSFQPSWALSSMFGRKVPGKCVLAKSSNVFVQLDGGLVTELNSRWSRKDTDIRDDEGFHSNAGFELSAAPNRTVKEVDNMQRKSSSILFEYIIDNYTNTQPFDLEFRWKSPLVWSCPQAPFHASRFLMGSGCERGAIAISLRSTESSWSLLSTDAQDDSCSLWVDIFQVVPWYVKVYFHTLQVFVDGQQNVTDVIERLHVSPSEDKVLPGTMEMVLKLPCNAKSAALTLEFDKGFLHISEYPPDALQGFDIPSAVVSFPDFHARTQFLEDNSSDNSPLLSRFLDRSPVLSYTEVLLVPLTTPDFSMPYNVITITCTVCALYFGSLLNALRKRAGEEERLLKSKGNKTGLPALLLRLSSKLRGRPSGPPDLPSSRSSSSSNRKLIFKVILVAAVAAVWQYYFR